MLSAVIRGVALCASPSSVGAALRVAPAPSDNHPERFRCSLLSLVSPIISCGRPLFRCCASFQSLAFGAQGLELGLDMLPTTLITASGGTPRLGVCTSATFCR
eukprot:10940689-Karenia_brevis.AAC.1